MNKIDKNYVNIILNIIKTDLEQFLLCINKYFKNIIKIDTGEGDLILSTKIFIQNIFNTIRNSICKINFIDKKKFKIFNFYFLNIKKKINLFVKELLKFMVKKCDTFENIQDRKIYISNYCYDQYRYLIKIIK